MTLYLKFRLTGRILVKESGKTKVNYEDKVKTEIARLVLIHHHYNCANLKEKYFRVLSKIKRNYLKRNLQSTHDHSRHGRPQTGRPHGYHCMTVCNIIHCNKQMTVVG